MEICSFWSYISYAAINYAASVYAYRILRIAVRLCVVKIVFAPVKHNHYVFCIWYVNFNYSRIFFQRFFTERFPFLHFFLLHPTHHKSPPQHTPTAVSDRTQGLSLATSVCLSVCQDFIHLCFFCNLLFCPYLYSCSGRKLKICSDPERHTCHVDSSRFVWVDANAVF